jgi:DNA-binding ferritin-like protein
MPLRHTDKGWYWGGKGPFDTKAKALAIARAAYAHGYEEQAMETNKVAEFIATLLHSATIAHMMHLAVEGEGSYAKHKALGGYYDGIVELVDSLAEQIQGAYDEIIQPYPTAFGSPANNDALAYMKVVRQYVRTARNDMPMDSEIQNEIDEIAKLVNTTCYKLTRLR